MRLNNSGDVTNVRSVTATGFLTAPNILTMASYNNYLTSIFGSANAGTISNIHSSGFRVGQCVHVAVAFSISGATSGLRTYEIAKPISVTTSDVNICWPADMLASEVYLGGETTDAFSIAIRLTGSGGVMSLQMSYGL
jgi:hypothetical protein